MPSTLIARCVAPAWLTVCLMGGCIAEPWPDEYVSESKMWNVVAAGGYHSCGVMEGYGMKCWGCSDPEYVDDQCDVPSSGMFGMLAAGPSANCAVDGGQLTCWGANHLMPGGDGFEFGGWDHVSVGGDTICGIRGDEASCWGELADTDQAFDVLEGHYQTIELGLTHGCAIDTDGFVSCLGDNSFGQSNPPVELTAKLITAGHTHSCAVSDVDRRIRCWGCDEGGDYGQCDVPEDLNDYLGGGDTTVVQITAGKRHTCALESDGTVHCWGCDYELDEVCDPWYLMDQLQSIDAGREHTCGVTFNGHVVCWGNNDSGQRNPP